MEIIIRNNFVYLRELVYNTVVEVEAKCMTYGCEKMFKGNIPDELNPDVEGGNLKNMLIKHHNDTKPSIPSAGVHGHIEFEGFFENGMRVEIHVSSGRVSWRELDKDY